MSKITFRADDELIEQLEEFDASKSEIMREALREFLDESEGDPSAASPTASDTGAVEAVDPTRVDDLVADRVDAVLADRLEEATGAAGPQDVNVTIALEGEAADASRVTADAQRTPSTDPPSDADVRKTTTDAAGAEPADPEASESDACSKCGEEIAPGHVYCPNCGEKATHRVFCECGNELRSDWGFCPGCGRRTPAADVLDGS